MEYRVRYALKEDMNGIMRFIDRFWRRNHILSRNRELFEWQYGGNKDRLNIIIGVDEKNEIQGMLGFVPYRDSDDKDFALALWKANPITGFLGVKLIKYLMENEPHRTIVCPGINLDTTKKIYEYLGMTVGTMKQWYRLAKKDSYKIARIVNNEIPLYETKAMDVKLIKLDSVKELEAAFDFENSAYLKGVPYKSLQYIQKRYYDHPMYDYIVYALKDNKEKSDTLFVFRVQDCNDSHALRMIDCIGQCDRIEQITDEIDKLLVEYDCEYVDVYEAGIKDETMISGGWKKVMDEGNIIPDYFSPYEQRKVDIHYSSENQRVVLFKGDGDQDRPS